MDPVFRQSMSWLHTWSGVVIGSLLFAIFWMGTLSVFDREIDRWMKPGTRLSVPEEAVSLDRTVIPFLEQEASDALRWQIMLPTRRVPVVSLKYDRHGETVIREINPVSGDVIPDQGTLAGTGFIFPFHFGLHLRWHNIGFWPVGIAGMTMLLQIVSGVLIHRKIFVEFFTFRRSKSLRRAGLDLHTLTGVLALPFHFFITLSGLIIFVNVYFPQAYIGAYGNDKEAKALYSEEASGRFSRDKSGQPENSASLDAMLEEAQREWAGSEPYFVRIWNPGDTHSYVEVRRSPLHEVSMNIDRLFFDGASGKLLERFEPGPAMKVQRFIASMHFVRFQHRPLRFLYFFGGLVGCIMIATGFLFWLESRRKVHTQQGLAGVRIVDGLTVGTVTGLIIATLMFFIVNRLLPLKASLAGIERASLEVWSFYLAWIITFIHAWLRPRRAWFEQCVAITVLAVTAVVLNAITTGDHLLHTLKTGMSAIAGMDLALLLCTCIALFAAYKLKQRPMRSITENNDEPEEDYV